MKDSTRTEIKRAKNGGIKMYIVTNTDQKIYIGQDYTKNRVDIKAQDVGLFYVVDPKTDATIRESLTQVATTGLTVATFEVADSSVFRTGEIVGWYASNGTTRKGSLSIESIVDATNVLVRIDKNNDTGTNILESGDKLQYLPDQKIPDGDSIEILTRRSTTILVKADAAIATVSMVVTKLYSTVQKKK